MKAAFITAFFALFVSFVVAQTSTTPFYITSPLQGDSYKAGSTVTIQWNNGIDNAAKVTLLTGTNAATMKSAGVTFTINGSDGEYNWKVPTNLPQNATFAFEIDYKDSTGATASSFSAPFTITGTTGTVVTQSFVSVISTAAPTSSAVISSSAPVSSSIPVTSVRPSTAAANATSAASASVTASASTTPTPAKSAAIAGFKAPIAAVCVIAFIASALFL